MFSLKPTTVFAVPVLLLAPPPPALPPRPLDDVEDTADAPAAFFGRPNQFIFESLRCVR
jgi:hypothetical protein